MAAAEVMAAVAEDEADATRRTAEVAMAAAAAARVCFRTCAAAVVDRAAVTIRRCVPVGEAIIWRGESQHTAHSALNQIIVHFHHSQETCLGSSIRMKKM